MSFAGFKLPTLAVASRDFTASIVVFLVAMPLCMGIAIASGVPPEKGLITGIIGGIVVGALAGSPLQVSGPAAGLAVVVFELVRDKGLSALGPILILAGLIQLIAGILKVGGWFRAISPAVVHGMLAGIGVLIVVGQFHVLFDARPLPSGIQNLLAIPGRLFGLSATNVSGVEQAFMIGLLTIAAMLGWDREPGCSRHRTIRAIAVPEARPPRIGRAPRRRRSFRRIRRGRCRCGPIRSRRGHAH